MKYRPQFRLLLKLVGVYLFVDGVLSLLPSLSWILLTPGYDLSGVIRGMGREQFIKSMLFSLAGALAKIAAGLYLFFGGKLIVNLAIPRDRLYCPECACELSGPTEVKCPDCGFVQQTGGAD